VCFFFVGDRPPQRPLPCLRASFFLRIHLSRRSASPLRRFRPGWFQSCFFWAKHSAYPSGPAWFSPIPPSGPPFPFQREETATPPVFGRADLSETHFPPLFFQVKLGGFSSSLGLLCSAFDSQRVFPTCTSFPDCHALFQKEGFPTRCCPTFLRRSGRSWYRRAGNPSPPPLVFINPGVRASFGNSDLPLSITIEQRRFFSSSVLW